MEFTPGFIEAMRKFAEADPMKCEIVGTDAEYAAAVERHAKEGRRVAAVSNAGLKDPQRRITFLPNSAFTN